MKRLTLGLLLVLALALSPSLLFSQGYTWMVPGDFTTIQEANDSASVALSGDTIIVGPGSHAGALLTKSLEIVGEGGATIDSGPAHPSGLVQGFRLLAGSSGTTFSHLTFAVDLAIISGAVVNDVTVTHCTFLNAVQGISNWRGNKWNITHNVITDLRTRCGGGIGILVGDYGGGIVDDNVVAHNKISGTLHVSAGDCGEYNGTGIVLYADFRWGRAGSARIGYNRVVKNKIALTSDTPSLVDVVAIELTDTRDDGSIDQVIHDNAIGFNDLRDTQEQLYLTPTALGNANSISRNLGENRGHGLHPNVFGPGGN